MGAVKTMWAVDRMGGGRFPFRVTIRRGDQVLLALRARDRWPGAGTTVFCLHDADQGRGPAREELERVPVASMSRLGKRLTVVLDRSRRRRCEFLFLVKGYSTREGTYEQVFWQTQQSLRQRRPRARFVGGPASHTLDVVVDSGERYAWKLPGCDCRRQSLEVGDYVLLVDDDPVAVVERKTSSNLLRDLSDLRALHHQLAELAAQPSPALVVEAAYADFLKPRSIHPLNVAYTSRALAEITAAHHGLQVVWAGSRKLAAQWTAAFFREVRRLGADRAEPVVQEALAFYGADDREAAGTDFRVQKVIRQEMPDAFPIAALRTQFPELPDARLRRVLGRLRQQGELRREGHGRAARWVKLR